MSPERWAKIEEIFQLALDEPRAKRLAFIRNECGQDAELCAEVKKLMDGHDTGSPFLESPVWTDSQLFQTTLKNKILSLDDEAGGGKEANDALIGQHVGSYRLIEEIGRGGMGVVYLGRRDEDFQQKVAVKIVKRGMDTDFILRRFRQERQVLAALNHNNIGRRLDGGTTSDGRPFLVMEYVEGQPVDRYCDEHKLPIRERLQLFQAVCSAVSYSHQRLVIHRDIKPSNILVTPEGEPKLLDFGIAKLLDRNLASASYQTTATHARMMTPDYASPEQLRGEEVTTVSDVYSLGVVLYNLLTGHLPFSYNSGRQNFARVVSEQKPERPSAAINRSEKTAAKETDKPSNQKSLTEVADNRRTQPERLRRYLAEDLDNIVLKALHKEPSRRYSSVEQLSEDIRRHLEGIPVKARGDDFVYKTRKFVQRHRASVLSVVLLVLTLLGGIAATARQARIADAERARAQRRFDDSRKLSQSLMFEIHDAIRDLQGATAARELLAKRTLEHLDALALDAAGDADLQTELAIAYINLGNIQGNPYYPNLGDTNGALASYRKAEALTEALSAAAPDNRKLRRRYWLTQLRIADILSAQGDLPAAAEIYAHARDIIEKLAAANPNEESLQRDMASSYDRQGNILMKTGDFQGALEGYGKSLTMFEHLSAAQPGDDALRRAVGAGHGKRGTAYLKSGEADKALTSYRNLLRINQERLATNPSNAVTLDDVAGSWRELGDAQKALGNYAEAFISYDKQLEMYLQLTAADPANIKSAVELAVSYQRLGNLQIKVGELKNAVENHEKSLNILRELQTRNSENTSVVNQLPPAFFYAGEAFSRLAAAELAAAKKTEYLKTARDYFEKSKQSYSALPLAAISLPEGIKDLRDIETCIAEVSCR